METNKPKKGILTFIPKNPAGKALQSAASNPGKKFLGTGTLKFNPKPQPQIIPQEYKNIKFT